MFPKISGPNIDPRQYGSCYKDGDNKDPQFVEPGIYQSRPYPSLPGPPTEELELFPSRAYYLGT